MKKILSVLIPIVLSFIIVSCGQKEFIFDDETDMDFQGAEFTVYSDGQWLSEKRQRGGSASSDRFLDRIEETEKNYNMAIRNEYGNIETKVLAMTLNGGGGIDMLYCGNDILFNFYNLGILMPFEKIGVKDNQNEKFGIPSLLLEGTFDGIQYGIINYSGDSVPEMSGLIGINMTLLKSLSMDNPHEYVERGEWNWANFKAVLTQGTFNDGEINHVGMLCHSTLGGLKAFLPAIIANGGYIIKEIDGVYKSGLTESNATEAMEFMTGLLRDGLIQIGGGVVWDVFNEGKTWPLANDGILSTSPDIEYSVVRFPYGPSGNKDIVAGYSLNRTYYAFTILSSFEDTEIGIIVDDLFEPLDASLYPEGWKDYAKENLFYSDSDYQTYITGLDTINFYPLGILYGTNTWSHNGEVEVALDRIFRGQGSIQSELDKVKDLLTEKIDEKLNKTK